MSTFKSQWEYTQEFEKAMRQAGIDCPDPIIADGEIHRFKPGGKGKPNGWYIFHGMAGAFGDWSSGIKEKWSADNSSTSNLTPLQREQMMEEIKKARKAQQEETIRKNQEASETAIKDWNSFSETGQSDYLIRKKVDAVGIRFGKGCIVIPLYDVEGKLWSYQKIYDDGNKLLLAGGRKKGCFHTLGQLDDSRPLYITEGYATGASVYMATGITTVVAIDAGNLESVVCSLRKKYPKSGIIIAADNDCWKNDEDNVGRIKACSARTKYRCSVVLPSFQNTENKPTDFNDLHVLEGLEAVQQQMGSIDSVLNEMPEGFPELRPLYNLHDLTQRPEAHVLIVEGEKPAEAAKGLFPDHVVTTSVQGSQSPHKNDWSVLRGRNVIICPNFDSPSIQYGNTIVQLCRNVEVNSLHYLPVQDLVRKLLEKSEIAEGYDLADAVSDGLTAEILKQHSLSDFLIPISENETISDLIKNRLQRLFDKSLFPVFKKTKLFKKNVKEASTQSKKNQQEKAEIDAKIAAIDTEIQEQESCLKKKEEALPSLKLTATQQKEISLKQSGDAESKAAFKQAKQADEERKNCQRFIKNLEDILCVKHREKTVLQSKAAVLMQQIDDAANIETRLQSEALAVFKTWLSSEEVSSTDHSSRETKALFSFFENEKIKCEELFSEARYLLQDESLLIVRQVNEDTSSAHDAYDINGLPKGFHLNEDGSQKKVEIGSDVEIANRVFDDLVQTYKILIHTEGSFWRYHTTHWETIPDQELRLAVHLYDGAYYTTPKGEPSCVKLSKSRVDSALNEMAALATETDFFKNTPVGINCANGFIEFDQQGKPTLKKHDRDHRCRHTLPGCWNPESPTWIEGSLHCRLLTGVFEGDSEDDIRDKIKLLQEVFGSSALGYGTKIIQPRAVILKGERAENGKSQILDAMRGLLPASAISTVTATRMGDERHILGLVGKLLNASDELSGSAAISSDTFKAIITGEPVSGRDVYKSRVEFRSQAQHVFAANTLPSFQGGMDRGVQRRLVVIPFNCVIPKENRIENIGKRIAEEEPDLLLAWAVEGASRLIKQRNFTMPQSSKEALSDWLFSADSVQAWFQESVILIQQNGDYPHIKTNYAYSYYKEWAETEGYRKEQILGINGFVQRMKTMEHIHYKRKETGAIFVGMNIRRDSDVTQSSYDPKNCYDETQVKKGNGMTH